MALIKVDHKIKVVSMLKFCCCCSYCCKCVTTKRKFACTFEKIALVHITSHHITALCLSRNSKINMAFGRRKTATTLFHFPFHVVVNLVESLTRPPLFLLLFSTCFFLLLFSLCVDISMLLLLKIVKKMKIKLNAWIQRIVRRKVVEKYFIFGLINVYIEETTNDYYGVLWGASINEVFWCNAIESVGCYVEFSAYVSVSANSNKT